MLAKEQYASKEVAQASKDAAKEQHTSKEVAKESVSKEPHKKYAKLSLGGRPHGPPLTHRIPETSNVPTRTLFQTPVCQVTSQDGYILRNSQYTFFLSCRNYFRQYPIMWRGPLALKSTFVSVQMHFVSGNSTVAKASLPPIIDGGTSVVRIAQRMRLEPTQLDAVYRKIQVLEKHSILLALPFGKDPIDFIEQSNNLKFRLIDYLFTKDAAGIISVTGAQQTTYVIHIFPACDFIQNNLARVAPALLQLLKELSYLVIIIIEV